MCPRQQGVGSIMPIDELVDVHCVRSVSVFTADEVLDRAGEVGDLFAKLQELHAPLPEP